MDGLGVAFGNGEQCLANHAFQQSARQGNLGGIGELGQLGELLCGDADDGKPAVAAFQSGHVLFIYRDSDGFRRGAPHNVGEKLGAEHGLAGLHHKGGNHRGDAQLQIIGAQLQPCFGGAEQDAFQSGDGGFGGNSALDIADSFGNVAFVHCKFHGVSFPGGEEAKGLAAFPILSMIS